MLTWLLIGMGVAALGAWKIIHGAEKDDRKRKQALRRGPLADRYKG